MADRYYTIDADSHVEEPEEAWGFLFLGENAQRFYQL